MEWINLKKDTPQEIKFLCDIGEKCSVLVENIKSADKIDINKYSSLLFNFDRLRTTFITIIKTRINEIKKVDVISIQQFIHQDDEKVKTISTPIIDYLKRFDEDMKNYQQKIEQILDGDFYSEKSKLNLIYEFTSLESYIHDAIMMGKNAMYSKSKIKLRDESLKEINNIINHVIEHLDEAAEWFYQIRPELDDDEINEIMNYFIFVLKRISISEKISLFITESMKNRINIKNLLLDIKNNNIYNCEKIKSYSKHVSRQYLITKIKTANNFNFEKIKYLDSKSIDRIISFPEERDFNIFWEFFISCIIQRGGIFVQKIVKGGKDIEFIKA